MWRMITTRSGCTIARDEYSPADFVHTVEHTIDFFGIIIYFTRPGDVLTACTMLKDRR